MSVEHIKFKSLSDFDRMENCLRNKKTRAILKEYINKHKPMFEEKLSTWETTTDDYEKTHCRVMLEIIFYEFIFYLRKHHMR